MSEPLVVVLLGERLGDSDVLRTELEERLGAALVRLCNGLGILPVPALVVRPEPGGRAVRVQIGIERHGIGLRTLQRIAAIRGFDQVGPQSEDGELEDAYWDALARGGAANLEAETFVTALAQMIAELLHGCAGELFGGAQAEHFLDTWRSTEGLGPPPRDLEPSTVREILSEVLRLGTPLVETRHVAESIAWGLEHKLPPEHVAEIITARLRPRTLTVAAGSETLRSLAVKFSEAAVPVEESEPTEQLRESLSLMSDGMFYELGIRIPEVRLAADADLPEGCFSVWFAALGSRTYRGLRSHELLVNEIPERLQRLGIEARPSLNPANRRPVSIVDAAQAELLDQRGYTTWDTTGFVVLTLAGQLRREAWLLPDRDVVELELSLLHQAFPDLVEAVLSRISTLHLTRILRALLRDEIMVRDLRLILESVLQEDLVIAEHRPALRNDAPHYTELVRAGMKSAVTHKYVRDGNTVVVCSLDPGLEEKLASLAELRAGADGDRVRAAEGVMRAELVRRAVSAVLAAQKSDELVILTRMELRAYLRGVLEEEFPGVAVLSHNDLSPDSDIQLIERVTIPALVEEGKTESA